MFCRNCAEFMLDTDVVCSNCGFAAGDGTQYCANCGSPTVTGAVVCEICGKPVTNPQQMNGGMQFQQQPNVQYGQQYAQQPQQQLNQQFQQPGFQQPGFQQQAFQQSQQFTGGQFQQRSNPFDAAQQQFRQDPNAAFGQNQGTYIPPNAFGQGNVNAGQQYYQNNVTYKSRVTAGILGILLGGLGVHNFYLGYTSKAVVQLLLTVCSCGALLPISWIWGFVEGVMLLAGSTKQDGRGLPLKD